MTIDERFRLVTRSDFDGLVCAMLFRELKVVNEVSFAHPKDVQDGLVDLSENDITANLPYDPRVQRAFDHHASERTRVTDPPPNYVNDPDAPSAASVIYNYYGGANAFPELSPEILAAVDKADSAQFTQEEVLHPTGWALLNFIMDSRTGLGRFRKFRVSNYELMTDLIDYCRDHTIEEILALPDVVERIELLEEHEEPFREQIRRCTTVHGNLSVLDLREEETIYVGNRFLIYALYPDTNISMHVFWGKQKKNTVFAVGKSIFNKTSKTKIGDLMLKYGGGGHDAAGTCQVPHADAPNVQQDLIAQINADG